MSLANLLQQPWTNDPSAERSDEEVKTARSDTCYGKASLGRTSDFGGGIPDPKPGFAVWVECGEVFTAPEVDGSKFGGHAYDGYGYDMGIRDCPCGCFMLSCSSGGPVDPFGPCPKNPK